MISRVSNGNPNPKNSTNPRQITSIRSVRIVKCEDHGLTHTRTMDITSSMEKFGNVMNMSTKEKNGKLFMDGCADTSVAFINDTGFQEVSGTMRSVTLVGYKKEFKLQKCLLDQLLQQLITPLDLSSYNSMRHL